MKTCRWCGEEMEGVFMRCKKCKKVQLDETKPMLVSHLISQINKISNETLKNIFLKQVESVATPSDILVSYKITPDHKGEAFLDFRVNGQEYGVNIELGNLPKAEKIIKEAVNPKDKEQVRLIQDTIKEDEIKKQSEAEGKLASDPDMQTKQETPEQWLEFIANSANGVFEGNDPDFERLYQMAKALLKIKSEREKDGRVSNVGVKASMIIDELEDQGIL